jgi:hypothetical protein
LYFVVRGFSGLCEQLNGIWELYPYAVTVGSTPYWKPYNPNRGNTTSVLNWFAYRDVATGIFYLYIAYGQDNHTLGDYMPRSSGWRLINSYRMCDESSFVVSITDLTAIPCADTSSPSTITMTTIPCCRKCYSFNLPYTDVKYFEVTFPSGENVEIDGYGNMIGGLQSTFSIPIASFGGYPPAFDSCCYGGGYITIAGDPLAEFSLCYMQSSNQAVLRVTLLNVVHGTGGNAYRWFVCNNFDPSAGGDFYLSLVLDDGGLAALEDSSWRTTWTNVATFNAAYTNGDFSNVLSDTWPNKITVAAPSSCSGYSYTSPPPPCNGNCNYVAYNIAPPGYEGSNTGTPGEYVVWIPNYNTGFEPTCSAGCGCFPFTPPLTVPFDGTLYSQYLTFCDLHSYPNLVGERLETGCV